MLGRTEETNEEATMLTVKSAAANVGVSPGLVYAWVETGILPHYRMGKPGRRGAIRIAEVDLEAFIASLRKGEGPRESFPRDPKPTLVLKHLKLKS